jgi:hypothetical protein
MRCCTERAWIISCHIDAMDFAISDIDGDCDGIGKNAIVVGPDVIDCCDESLWQGRRVLIVVNIDVHDARPPIPLNSCPRRDTITLYGRSRKIIGESDRAALGDSGLRNSRARSDFKNRAVAGDRVGWICDKNHIFASGDR